MELSLVLSDDTDQFSATIGQFIETNVADTLADRVLAQAAASAAAASQAAALASQTDADGAATSAGTSATNAAASATAAGLSASGAASSATTATAQATASMNSASASAGSASAASISAGNAAGSATAASISAGNAAATLTNALMKQNNLTDIANAVTALANLGGAPLATVAPITGRNRIINGAGNVGQYTANTVLTGTISGIGPLDRFAASNGTGGGTITQSIGTITWNGIAYNAIKQTATAVPTTLSSGYWSGIFQTIEAVNCYDLPGNQVATQFVFQASLAGTYNYCLRCVGGTIYTYISTFTYTTAGAPQLITIILPSIPIAAALGGNGNAGMNMFIGALTNASATSTSSNLGTWQAGSWIAAPTPSIATNWAATAGNYISATLISLEKGNVNHPFENLKFSEILAQCQRYYWNTGSATSSFIMSAMAYTTSAAYGGIRHPVQMRTAPTVTLGTALVRIGGEYVGTALVSADINAALFTNAWSSTPFTAGNAVLLVTQTVVTPSISFSAEL